MNRNWSWSKKMSWQEMPPLAFSPCELADWRITLPTAGSRKSWKEDETRSLQLTRVFLWIFFASYNNDEWKFGSFFGTPHFGAQASCFQYKERCNFFIHSRANKNFIATSIKVSSNFIKAVHTENLTLELLDPWKLYNIFHSLHDHRSFIHEVVIVLVNRSSLHDLVNL